MTMNNHTSVNTTGFSEVPPKKNEIKRFFRVFFGRGVVLIGAIIIFIIILMAIFAPLVAPYDPIKPDASASLENPSKTHLLGTDLLGRDVLSRIIFGSRIALMVGVIATSIASIIGVIMGLVAGYFGGWINNLIMRVTDALMSIPPIMLALAVAALLGGGLINVMISVGISLIPTYCRLMCSEVLYLKESDYIMATKLDGASNLRIIMKHILPNAFPPIIVLITLNMGLAIMAEASLSFLGIGISPPAPAWGGMVSDGYRYINTNPILSVTPGIAIMLIVLAFNIVGDGLRDALDPRLRGVI
jgi:peptide/nickel transport system permease protein